jgi:hypothetical protein
LALCGVVVLQNRNAYFVLPDSRSWTYTFQFSQLYFYRGARGYLPVIENAETNEFLNSLVPNEPIWLGGSRSQVNLEDGVYWAVPPLRGARIFIGLAGNGSVVEPFFSNFSELQPDSSGGAILLQPDGSWLVQYLYMFILLNFLNFLSRDMHNSKLSFRNVVMFHLDAVLEQPTPGTFCGKYGMCSCASLSIFCIDVHMGIVPEPIPRGIQFINLLNNDLTMIPNNFFPDTLIELNLDRNSLTVIPKPTRISSQLYRFTARVCLLLVICWFGTNVFFFVIQNNSISSLGHGQLASLSSVLTDVVLDDNTITAISDGALNGLSKLKFFSLASKFANCHSVVRNDIIALECTCSGGYATNPDHRTFCGLFLFVC